MSWDAFQVSELKLPPETHREWGRKIRMSEDVVRTVTEKWPRLGLPGKGSPNWGR